MMVKVFGKLTDSKVRQLNKPGRYNDGDGRYLQVSCVAGHTTKSWLLKYVSPLPHPGGQRFDTKGRPRGWCREMGFGSVHRLTLAEFRERARQARLLVMDGTDPIEERRCRRGAARAAGARLMTFKAAAEAYIKDHAAKWRGGISGASAEQWTQSLTDYAYPIISQLPVAMIEKSHVLAVIEPHWKTKTVTMDRVRNRIEIILDWAKGRGHRSGDNPAHWKGCLDAILPSSKQLKRVAHHAALPYSSVPQFMAKVRATDGVAARCLEFVILTASRWGEAQGAVWDEVNLNEALWTIPARRMKAGREHVVPLSGRAIELLRALPRHEGSSVVFASSQSARRPIVNKSVHSVMRECAGGVPVSLHGFRSSFRDWCGDATSFPREICEAALAHRTGDATESAYRRGSALQKRRELMERWSDFCMSDPAAKVIELKRHA
jgi:integrase